MQIILPSRVRGAGDDGFRRGGVTTAQDLPAKDNDSKPQLQT